MRDSTMNIKNAMHRAIDERVTDEWLDNLMGNIQYDFETGYEYDVSGIQEAAQEFLDEENTLHTLLVQAIADEIEVVKTVRWCSEY